MPIFRIRNQIQCIWIYAFNTYNNEFKFKRFGMLLSAGWCDSYKGLSLKTADAAVLGSYQASANRGGRPHWVKQYRYNLPDRNIAIVYFSLSNLPLFLRIKIRTSITWRVTYICFCSAVFGLVKMAGSANYTVACAVRRLCWDDCQTLTWQPVLDSILHASVWIETV